jgi:hypothetical protein
MDRVVITKDRVPIQRDRDAIQRDRDAIQSLLFTRTGENAAFLPFFKISR